MLVLLYFLHLYIIAIIHIIPSWRFIILNNSEDTTSFSRALASVTLWSFACSLRVSVGFLQVVWSGFFWSLNTLICESACFLGTSWSEEQSWQRRGAGHITPNSSAINSALYIQCTDVISNAIKGNTIICMDINKPVDRKVYFLPLDINLGCYMQI